MRSSENASSTIVVPISANASMVKSQNAWLIVALLMIVGCLNYLVRIMITTMKGSITEEIQLTDSQFGLLSSVFLWTYGLLSPFGGFLADKFKRSRVIIVSLILWSLITWATVLAKTFPQLLVTRVLMGISESCYIPAALSLIADYHGKTTRSLAVGLHMAGIMIGSGLSFTGGWLAEAHSWKYPFEFFGLIGVVYGVVLIFLLKDKKAPPQTNLDKVQVNILPAFKSLFSHGAFIRVFLYWGILGITWVIVGWLPTYYKEHFNLSQGTASLYATGFLYVMSLIGVLFGGWLADRISKNNIRGPILVPAFALCICAVAILVGGSTNYLYGAIAAFMVYAFTVSFSDSNGMPILCLTSDPRYRATGYGILNMLSCIVGGVGVYLGGVGLDAKVDFQLIFQLTAALIAINAVILFTIKPIAKYN